MPLKRCQTDDKPGWKWGDEGKCYPYTAGNEESEKAARKKAMAQAAAMGEFEGTGNRDADDTPPQAPVEWRNSNVSNVKLAQRIVELVAVPYEEMAIVEYREEIWQEVFSRGAFDGIEKRPGRVRANRDHDDRLLVGKAVKFHPSRQEGLVAEIRISDTPLGNETLALAMDDVLSASVGFAALGRHQELNLREKIRRIKQAYLDHIAFTPVPAYAGANVLAVRTGLHAVQSAKLPKLDTPSLDELRAWYQART